MDERPRLFPRSVFFIISRRGFRSNGLSKFCSRSFGVMYFFDFLIRCCLHCYLISAMLCDTILLTIEPPFLFAIQSLLCAVKSFFFVEFCRFPSSFRSPFYDHVNDVEEGYVELVRLMDTQSSTVNHGRRCVENYFLILHWKVRAKSILYFDFLALRWKRAVLRMKDSCYQPSFVDARGRWQPQLSKDVEQSFFLEFGDFLARVPDLVNAKQFSLDVDFDAA